MLLLGAFMFPEAILACEKMSEKSAEAFEIDNAKDSEKSTSCERYCCKKADDSEKAAAQKHDCDGSCQGNCHRVITHFNFALPTSIDDLSSIVNVFFSKDNFYSSKTQTTSGFYFIWIPPNIES